MLKTTATFLALWACAEAAPCSPAGPTAHVRNGTYVGVRNEGYDQDFFLGMPYAQQPVGDLRFKVPSSLNDSWVGEREATQYSDACVGYGSDSIWYPTSEACLTVNVVRSSSAHKHSNLPVGVWIHGGGFHMGSGRDKRYNTSAMVQNSYEIGKPFIAVTLNYRLSAWGFISSSEVSGTGNTNLGLRDQRLALHWIQENIRAFGGDPDKVTIWGESAGGMSVGVQLAAYGGRDDGLFRGAIMESGGTISYNPMNSTGYQDKYKELVAKVGCSDSTHTLQCLREVPFEQLNSVLNGTNGVSDYNFAPVVDGDLIKDWGSKQLDNGEFVKVPIISGTNTDEGTAFAPTGINTTEQFHNYLTDGFRSSLYLPDPAADRILELYPNDPSQGIPAFLGDQRLPSKGYQYRRVAAFAGDYVMHANRRRQCEAYAAAGAPAYCYRFDVRNTDVGYLAGATHFEEISFVFHNFQGRGYHSGKPFVDVPQSNFELSTMMTRMWASFIHDLNPNFASQNPAVHWDPYAIDTPADLVFDTNVTSHMEPDTWRGDGMAYISSIAPAFWR